MTPENESEDGMVKNFKEQELDSRMICQKIQAERDWKGVGEWQTADERVERVGCMVRRSEMEEGLLYWSDL